MNQYIKLLPILLPQPEIDPQKWAVVACDQFSSEPTYWKEVEQYVGDAPSTLHLILPEAFLSEDQTSQIDRINDTMRAYTDGSIFREISSGMILTERTTKNGHCRKGIVTCVDLEAYSYHAEDNAPIRATEGTVLSRIPPRVKIREGATLELPHVLMLMDDQNNRVLDSVQRGELLYSFDLNMNGGHLKGWSVANAKDVLNAFDGLLDSAEQTRKYGEDAGLFLAVGDGNHSIATAKTCWDNIKKDLTEEERLSQPARYALVEIENIFDSGILFEPIYRVVFGEVDQLPQYMIDNAHGDKQSGVLITPHGEVKFSQDEAAVAAIMDADRMIADYGQTHRIEVDYVHGIDSVRELAARGAVGILLPTLQKADLFKEVAAGRILPRKTFSMGEAREKRYYNECKKIK